MAKNDNNPEYPDENLNQQTRAEDIYGRFNPFRIPAFSFLKSSGTPPVNTDIPKTIFDQFRLWTNGSGTYRLYYYDNIGGRWVYINIDGSV